MTLSSIIQKAQEEFDKEFTYMDSFGVHNSCCGCDVSGIKAFLAQAITSAVTSAFEAVRMEKNQYEICTQCGGTGNVMECCGSTGLNIKEGYNAAIDTLNTHIDSFLGK